MTASVTLIGFGEAGATFARAAGWEADALAFDIKTGDPATRAGKLADYEDAGVRGTETLAAALDAAAVALSLVTADQALEAARRAAQHMTGGTLFFDMNSVAPNTKRAAAEAIEAAGGRYVDVAIMSPVNPARLSAPLLLSGSHAAAGLEALAALGFSNLRIVPGEVGRASSIKMIRSVMVKGMEALTAECALAADRAGVRDEVLESLGKDWPEKVDYNLDRMMLHGLRRAAEMEEVAKTLESLGVEPLMTRGTVARQRAIGGLGICPAPVGLDTKLERLNAA